MHGPILGCARQRTMGNDVSQVCKRKKPYFKLPLFLPSQKCGSDPSLGIHLLQNSFEDERLCFLSGEQMHGPLHEPHCTRMREHDFAVIAQHMDFYERILRWLRIERKIEIRPPWTIIHIPQQQLIVCPEKVSLCLAKLQILVRTKDPPLFPSQFHDSSHTHVRISQQQSLVSEDAFVMDDQCGRRVWRGFPAHSLLLAVLHFSSVESVHSFDRASIPCIHFTHLVTSNMPLACASTSSSTVLTP
mmetsp:Transcript_2339/g.15644  ORF Transcript_2339/g.15644 Transcript_2339/m.15644 type:complete len:245 (+) Transcript_2339:992-1726(+)